jgi:hypothetical protein
MDWALDMQDPADGGVYFRVASATWDGGLPQQVDDDRLVAEKTTHATAAFAAMAAIHARLLADARPERAATVLAAARQAWRFLQTHPQWPAEGERYRNPPGIHAGEYPDPSAQDNILWAAAELYRSTGEREYHDAYRRLAAQVNIDPTGVVSFKDQGMAAHWAYLMAPWPDRDEVLLERARDIFLAAADWRIRKMQEHPYLAPVHQHRGFLGWGSFAHSSRATLTLFQAWQLSGRPHYLEWAWQTPHPQLGANPQSVSYITGIGARSPRFPLSTTRCPASRSTVRMPTCLRCGLPCAPPMTPTTRPRRHRNPAAKTTATPSCGATPTRTTCHPCPNRRWPRSHALPSPLACCVSNTPKRSATERRTLLVV